MKCPKCEQRLHLTFADRDGEDWQCAEQSCDGRFVVYGKDESGNPVPKNSPLKLDDAIDFALEILENTPIDKAPLPGFWAEVLELISMMDGTIARSQKLDAVSFNQLETSIQLGLMREALQRQYEIEMELLGK